MITIPKLAAIPGRSLPPWITGLAFISANLGAQEVIGMGASGAKYGIATSHFYWIGAIPAMVFFGLFVMPFYYGSRASGSAGWGSNADRRRPAGSVDPDPAFDRGDQLA